MAPSSHVAELPADHIPTDSRSVSDESDSTDEEGWEDVEADDETQPVIGLFSEQVFPDVRSMLKDCKEKHSFDLLKIQKDLGTCLFLHCLKSRASKSQPILRGPNICCPFQGLDFLGTIKLVNYIRSEVKAGNKSPDVSSETKFEDDVYLKPVMEDDALLYSLVDSAGDIEEVATGTDAERRVLELQEDLERLQTQFSEYRLAVQKSLEDQLSKEDDKLESKAPASEPSSKIQEADADYFVSYAYNGTHITAATRTSNNFLNVLLT